MREELLDRFEKIFAPQAEVYIFFDMPGEAFDSVRVPGTQQLIVGLSVGLYNAVSRRIFEKTGRQIRREIPTQIVFGRAVSEIAVRTPIDALAVEVEPQSFVPAKRLILAPKPV